MTCEEGLAPMLDNRFSELVELCLRRLDQGEDLLEVLADHAEYQEKLKPLLLVAMTSRALPVPVPKQFAQRLGKRRLLDKMNQLQSQNAFRKSSQIPSFARLSGNLVSFIRSLGLTKPSPNFRLAMVALIMVFGGGFFTYNASATGFSDGFLHSLDTGFRYVLDVINFRPDLNNELEFGQIPLFTLHGLSFDDQVSNKVVSLIDLEESASAGFYGQGYKYQKHKGDDNGVFDNDDTPSDEKDKGLAKGHDKDKENNGLALGLDKDDGGLALGHDKDDGGLALGHDKDKDNNGLGLGHDKDKQDTTDDDGVEEETEQEDKVKEDKEKEDKVKDKEKK
jgi:hypothetical protein